MALTGSHSIASSGVSWIGRRPTVGRRRPDDGGDRPVERLERNSPRLQSILTRLPVGYRPAGCHSTRMLPDAQLGSIRVTLGPIASESGPSSEARGQKRAGSGSETRPSAPKSDVLPTRSHGHLEVSLVVLLQFALHLTLRPSIATRLPVEGLSAGATRSHSAGARLGANRLEPLGAAQLEPLGAAQLEPLGATQTDWSPIAPQLLTRLTSSGRP
jgi:hypothetical protein